MHVTDALMNQQLDKPASLLLKNALELKGLRFMLDAHTAEIVGPDRVTAVRFKDGTEIPADLVVMAAGVRPNIELAKQAGLHCERAIVVDDTLQTYDPRIYSVGECGGPDSEDLVMRDPRRGVYKRLVLQGSRVTGAVLYGDVQDGPWYFDLIQNRTDISSMRNHLLFGKALCGLAA